jgi:hypothetical protein
VFPGLPGAGAWFRAVLMLVCVLLCVLLRGVLLVRALLVGFGWRDVRGARRINVRF